MSKKYKTKRRRLKLMFLFGVPILMTGFVMLFTMIFVENKSTHKIPEPTDSVPFQEIEIRNEGPNDSTSTAENKNAVSILGNIPNLLPQLDQSKLTFTSEKCKKILNTFLMDADVFSRLNTSINFPFGLLIPLFKYNFNYWSVLNICLVELIVKIEDEKEINNSLLKSTINIVSSRDILGVYIDVLLDTMKKLREIGKSVDTGKGSLVFRYKNELKLLTHVLRELAKRFNNEVGNILEILKGVELANPDDNLDTKELVNVLTSLKMFRKRAILLPFNLFFDIVNLFFLMRYKGKKIVLTKRNDFMDNPNNRFIESAKIGYTETLCQLMKLLTNAGSEEYGNKSTEIVLSDIKLDALQEGMEVLILAFMDTTAKMVLRAIKHVNVSIDLQ